MSAILDALKRQEAERKRQRDGLTAERRSLPKAKDGPPPQAHPGRVLLALGGAVALGLMLVFKGERAPILEPSEPPEQGPRPPAAQAAAHAPAIMEATLKAQVATWRISAHIYGAERADRALWVNGKAYGEGDEIGGLTLEAITLEGFRVRAGETAVTTRVAPP